MPLFEKKLEDYLTIFKIPIGPNQLDPVVFYFSETGEPPKLLPSIYNQIMRDLEILSGGQSYVISKCYIVGSALKPGSKNRRGSIDIFVVLNDVVIKADVDGIATEQLLRTAKSLSGKLALGTVRPIRYIVSVRDIVKEKYDGIYDLNTNEWIKTPNGINK